jgi:hypothetical protein
MFKTNERETITVTLPARKAMLECAVNGPSENAAVVQNETWAGDTYAIIRIKIFTKVTDTCWESLVESFPLLLMEDTPSRRMAVTSNSLHSCTEILSLSRESYRDN